MSARPLWKVSISISSEGEGAVTELLEGLFGRAASIYTDFRSSKTYAEVYLPQQSDWSEENRARLLAGLKRIKTCGLSIGPGRVSVSRLQGQDWAESWKRHFKPMEIGKALLIKPSWNRQKPRAGQEVIVLDPGLSFGTGQHPTTRFCLEQLVEGRKSEIAQSFLDVGTGSGILAIAAVKLGYAPVRAFDFDSGAVRIARANARRNRVARKLGLTCEDLARLPLHSDRKFDVVCANLIYDLLLAEKNRLLNRLACRGTLVMAGILSTQFPNIRRAYEKSGLKLVARQKENEWESGAFVRV